MLSGNNTQKRFVACRYRDFWTEQGPTEIISMLHRGTITLTQAADLLNISTTSLHGLLEQVKKYFQYDVIRIQRHLKQFMNYSIYIKYMTIIQ